MPRSRLESAVVVAGIAALGLLVWLSVVTWNRYQRRQSAPEPAVSVHAEVGRSRTTAAIAAEPREPKLTGKLTLTATRGACWVELRAGSANGRRLFAGILGASRSISFSGRRFWLSLGAAYNVDARFGGRPVRGFPRGVSTVTIDGARARAVG
jgi:uncharacterized protein DUF4115